MATSGAGGATAAARRRTSTVLVRCAAAMSEPPSRPTFAVATAAMLRPVRGLLAMLVPDDPPLELNIVGRTVFHAVVVGLAAGLLGSAFFAGLELVQHVVLEGGAGYQPLLARGER